MAQRARHRRGQRLLLALVYGIVGYGLTSIVRWAAARLGRASSWPRCRCSRAPAAAAHLRRRPVLTTEMWQTFSAESQASAGAGGRAVRARSATVFLVARLPREVGQLERDAGAGPPLRLAPAGERGLVLFISSPCRFSWSPSRWGCSSPPSARWPSRPTAGGVARQRRRARCSTSTWWAASRCISEELLRVSAAIAAFSGLYYAIAVLTDSTTARSASRGRREMRGPRRAADPGALGTPVRLDATPCELAGVDK